MKKRILVLLSVVALMVMMLAMSVAPAFAAWYQTSTTGVLCRTGGGPLYIGNTPSEYHHKVDRNDDNYVCYSPSNNRIYDNRRS